MAGWMAVMQGNGQGEEREEGNREYWGEESDMVIEWR